MKSAFLLLLLAIIALLTIMLVPFVGMESMPFHILYSPDIDAIKADIFWKIRMPRVLTSFCAGSVLAISGMAFQALFRNPLATPFTLGISSGAALGAALYLKFGIIFTLIGISGQSLSAFLGAAASIFIVYGLTQVRKGFSTATMLLAGVAISFFFSSLILFVQYLSDFTNSFRIVRWLMGGFEIVGFRPLLSILPFVIIGSASIFALIQELNLMTLGEDIALSRGVNVAKTKSILFFGTSLMVGGVVSTCGLIGFVDLMSPHICRLLIGPDHRYLTPATFLFGGTFLTLCDTLARTLIAPAEIPVGIITACLGGPFFLWLLLAGSSERSVIQ